MDGKIKNGAIFLIVGAVIIGVYIFFFKGPADEAVLIAEPGTTVMPDGSINPGVTQADQATQEFLPILLNIKNIHLNDAIFTNQAFLSLRDSSILLIQDGNEGRPNPFAPIGSENVATPNTSTTTTNSTTSQPASSNPNFTNNPAINPATNPPANPGTNPTTSPANGPVTDPLLY